ncbi:MAG: thioredoxin fold domain-containing protein [Saprospiraceae bacterium]|nr:thioredoxin fold domain-containing protein [Saprospiraceae bacterium]
MKIQREYNFHGTFKEAMELASKEGKLIFMDAYTSWCGPCKRMAASVFPDPVAGEFFQSNFHQYESRYGERRRTKFVSKFNVQSYPTLLFIDGSGNLVHRASGARPVDGLIDLGKEALAKVDKSGDFAKLYNEGKKRS